MIFDEYTVVLKGTLQAESVKKILNTGSDKAVIAHAGERVCYSSQYKGGAEYIRCMPSGLFPGFPKIKIQKDINR